MRNAKPGAHIAPLQRNIENRTGEGNIKAIEVRVQIDIVGADLCVSRPNATVYKSGQFSEVPDEPFRIFPAEAGVGY